MAEPLGEFWAESCEEAITDTALEQSEIATSGIGRHLHVVPDLPEGIKIPANFNAMPLPEVARVDPEWWNRLPSWRQEQYYMPSGLNDEAQIQWLTSIGRTVIRYRSGGAPITYYPTY